MIWVLKRNNDRIWNQYIQKEARLGLIDADCINSTVGVDHLQSSGKDSKSAERR